MTPIKEPQGKEIREIFIKEFVWQIVKNIPIPQEENKEEKEEQPEEHEKPIPPITPTQPQQKQPQQIIRRQQQIQYNQPFPQRIPQQIPIARQQLVPIQKQATKLNIEKLALGRIEPILRDPTVLSVECPGPAKNILVGKVNGIQTAPFALTTEEINGVMNEISEKTRIPILKGLFKAVYNELLVTAIISDYIGTRFLIQKRMPFRMY